MKIPMKLQEGDKNRMIAPSCSVKIMSVIAVQMNT